MNVRNLPTLMLVLLYVCFLVSLLITAQQLPERVATHFDFDGVPDGWMSRSAHLWFMGLTGLLLPLFIVGVFAALRRLPLSLINIPHRNYWLSAKRQAQTFEYMFHHSLWLAVMMLAFLLGLNWLVVIANQRQPPQLSSRLVWGLASLFLAGVVIWVIRLLRHFHRPAAAPAS